MIVFGYCAQPSCSASLPGALYDSRLVVEAKIVARRNVFVSVNAAWGLTPPPKRPTIGGCVCSSPAAPLAFSGTCSRLQTVAAGMLTWYVEFFFFLVFFCRALLELRVCPPRHQQHAGLAGSKPRVWGTAAAAAAVGFDFSKVFRTAAAWE